MEKEGITFEPSAPYYQEQNGVSGANEKDDNGYNQVRDP